MDFRPLSADEMFELWRLVMAHKLPAVVAPAIADRDAAYLQRRCPDRCYFVQHGVMVGLEPRLCPPERTTRAGRPLAPLPAEWRVGDVLEADAAHGRAMRRGAAARGWVVHRLAHGVYVRVC